MPSAALLRSESKESSLHTAAAGRGRLIFEEACGRTRVISSYATSPLRLLTPQNQGSSAWVYTSSFGGGFVDKDHVDLELELRANARAVLLTQSSTKIFRGGSSQSLAAVLADNASLVSIPDPLVPFAASRFSQRQSFERKRSASLIVCDGLQAGREAYGERWQFESFSSRLDLRVDGVPRLREALRLNHETGELSARFGRFNCLYLVVISGPQVYKYGLDVAGAIGRERLSPRAELVVSASTVPDETVLIRVAATQSEYAAGYIRDVLAFLPHELGDNPWTRKW